MLKVLSARTDAFLQKYSMMLERSPVIARGVEGAVLWGLGDLLSQRLGSGHSASTSASHGHGAPSTSKSESASLRNAPEPEIDYKRLLATSAYGALFMAPVGGAWYHYMDLAVAKFVQEGTARFIATKVAADTLLFGPVHVACYFALMTKVSGGTLADVQHKLQSDFAGTFGAEAAFWVPIQALNFTFLRPEYHLLVVNLASILEAAGLAHIQHSSIDQILHNVGLRKEPSTTGAGAGDARGASGEVLPPTPLLKIEAPRD